MKIKKPIPHNFIYWLGQFGTYMLAEHDVDLTKEFIENPKAAAESAQFFMDCYQKGMQPKELADLLIERAQEKKEGDKTDEQRMDADATSS